MADTPREDLRARAQGVLDRNRRGAWTCPAVDFYPHQWLWDSSFVAIGVARVDPARAAGELRSLFRGQWANGMLPHMIFADDVRDFGSTRIWRSKSHPEAPRDVKTSCITQPPIPAIAAWRISQVLPTADRDAFLTEVFPHLRDHHRWLYRARDPHERGLITLIHPWECGLDTTPPWMESLREMWEPWWLRLIFRWRLARLVRFFRRDTRFAPAAERTSDDDGLRMLVLVQRAKRRGFDLARMRPDRSVLLEDLAFNAFLAVANRDLTEIATTIGETIEPDLAECFARTERALDELWDPETGQYYSRNAVTGELVTRSTVATFLPLWAGVTSPDQEAQLTARLAKPSGFWPAHPVPSVPTDAPEFEPDRYWKGPTWINMNWAVIEGLRRVGRADLGEALRRSNLELLEHGGLAEYFSAITGEGFGAEEFSWTAALALDLLLPARKI